MKIIIALLLASACSGAWLPPTGFQTQGRISFWDGSCSGSTVKDVWGSNNGSLSGSATCATGGGFNLPNSTSSWVQMGTAPGLTQNFWASAVIKYPGGVNYAAIMGQKSSCGHGWGLLSLGQEDIFSSEMGANGNCADVGTIAAPLAEGVYQHVTVWYGSGGSQAVRIYVNGKLAGSGTNTNGIEAAGNFRIGDDGAGNVTGVGFVRYATIGTASCIGSEPSCFDPVAEYNAARRWLNPQGIVFSDMNLSSTTYLLTYHSSGDTDLFVAQAPTFPGVLSSAQGSVGTGGCNPTSPFVYDTGALSCNNNGSVRWPTEPVNTASATLGNLRDPSAGWWNGQYWITGTNTANLPQTGNYIFSTPDLTNFTYQGQIVMCPNGTNPAAWAPKWVRNANGSLYDDGSGPYLAISCTINYGVTVQDISIYRPSTRNSLAGSWTLVQALDLNAIDAGFNYFDASLVYFGSGNWGMYVVNAPISTGDENLSYFTATGSMGSLSLSLVGATILPNTECMSFVNYPLGSSTWYMFGHGTAGAGSPFEYFKSTTGFAATGGWGTYTSVYPEAITSQQFQCGAVTQLGK